jgi:endonuclease VIII
MPEGDTIFRAATTLRKALVGARVTRFRSERLGSGPVGERIEEVAAQGKNLLLRFEKGRTLRTHMRMHGSWHLYREGERWQRPGFQAKVELHADNGFVAVCFAAPVVEWLRAGGLAHLGPDATADEFDAAEAHRRMRALDEMPLERALLTQTAMAGVGNVIKCEALFLEKLDPFQPVSRLDDAKLTALVERARQLLLRNRTAGPRTSRRAFDGSRLWVYGRGHRPCYTCGDSIRVRTTQRLTYYCPHCQK